MDQVLFTSASILDLLSNIDELKDKNISIDELDHGFNIVVGESTYQIRSSQAEEVQVDQEVVDQVEDITYAAYDSLADEGVDVDSDDEPVTGGPIKSLIKTLMLGGLVKMTADMLKN